MALKNTICDALARNTKRGICFKDFFFAGMFQGLQGVSYFLNQEIGPKGLETALLKR
jgi:hypothetical protein